MKNSSLAVCLEEFALTVDALNSRETRTPRAALSPAANSPMLAPRRRTLGTRSILIRDQGMRPFRVF